MINTLTKLFPILNGIIVNNNKWVVLEKDTTIIRYLKTDYSEAFSAYIKNTNHILSRGTDYIHNAIVETPRKRISITGNNMLNVLFSDVLPSWNNMPKRNECIIGINDYNIAKYYNHRNTYCLFPKNGAIVAIANKPCIQQVETKINNVSISIVYFTSIICRIICAVIYEDIYWNQLNEKDIIRLFNLVDIELKKNDINSIINRIRFLYGNINDNIISIVQAVLDNSNKNETLISFLDKTLSPKKLNIKSALYKDAKFNEDNEVWTESQCLLIEYDYFFDVILEKMQVNSDE